MQIIYWPISFYTINSINSISMLKLWFLLKKKISFVCCYFTICLEDKSQYSCGTHSIPNLSLVSTTFRNCVKMMNLSKIIKTFIKKGKLTFHWCRSTISFVVLWSSMGSFSSLFLLLLNPSTLIEKQICTNRCVVWLKGVCQTEATHGKGNTFSLY